MVVFPFNTFFLLEAIHGLGISAIRGCLFVNSYLDGGFFLKSVKMLLVKKGSYQGLSPAVAM